MSIIVKKNRNVSSFKNSLLSDSFINSIVKNLEERIEDFKDMDTNDLAEEIGVTLNFSYSSYITDYIYDNYESKENIESELETFIDIVIGEESPLDNDLISEDDEFFEALKECAELVKK